MGKSGSNKSFSTHKLNKFRISELKAVSDILYDCGRDMAVKLDLHHWDNSHFKNWVVVILCALKNDIYLIYSDGKPVATFQTHKNGQAMVFHKLATSPLCSGKGIGSYCLAEVEHMAKEAKCSEVMCEVYEKNEYVKNFYEHREYTICGTVQTVKYRELKMRKEI